MRGKHTRLNTLAYIAKELKKYNGELIDYIIKCIFIMVISHGALYVVQLTIGNLWNS